MEFFVPIRLPGHVNDRHITPASGPAEKPMPDYRAYIVGSDGQFKASEIVSATDDAAAIELARKFVTKEDGVEVWLLDRKVRMLDPEK